VLSGYVIDISTYVSTVVWISNEYWFTYPVDIYEILYYRHLDVITSLMAVFYVFLDILNIY